MVSWDGKVLGNANSIALASQRNYKDVCVASLPTQQSVWGAQWDLSAHSDNIV